MGRREGQIVIVGAAIIATIILDQIYRCSFDAFTVAQQAFTRLRFPPDNSGANTFLTFLEFTFTLAIQERIFLYLFRSYFVWNTKFEF